MNSGKYSIKLYYTKSIVKILTPTPSTGQLTKYGLYENGVDT